MKAPSESRVLIVEDEPALLRLTGQLLKNAGFRTIDTLDGDAALDQLAADADTIDVAFIDLGIPPRGGAALLSEMRERGGRFGVVMTSGGACPPEVSDLLKENGGSFLQKPFSAAQLLEAIRRAAEDPART